MVSDLNAKALRKLTPIEMEKKLDEIRAELSRTRAASASGGTLENPGRIRLLRHSIARMLTLMNEPAK